MARDRWTFLVVSGEEAPLRQYTVSGRTLRILAGVGSLLVATALGLGALAAVDGAGHVRAGHLEDRNRALAGEVEAFRDRVARLEATLDGLAQRDARYRTLAGLDTFDPEVLQAGVGGPGLGSLESYPLYEVAPDVAEEAFALSYDLGALERRARLLSESFDEAADSLARHRDLLESTPSILPTNGWMSSTFSSSRMHPVHNRPLPHEGVDVAAPRGTPIFAAAKGRVARAGWQAGYGLTVEIDHGYGYTTIYGHAAKVLVRRGQAVERGDVIAQVGSTGIATSPNLHYEVRVNGRPRNPANFILPPKVP